MFTSISIELETWLCPCGGDNYKWSVCVLEGITRFVITCGKCDMIHTVPITKVPVNWNLQGCPGIKTPAKPTKMRLAALEEPALDNELPTTMPAARVYEEAKQDMEAAEDIPF